MPLYFRRRSGDYPPMKPHPKVAVIVLNWNGLADTSACLESLQAITYAEYETILIDNGSRGDDAGVLGERFGGFVRLIVSERNLGFAGGCNLGIRDALQRSPDYVLLLNNDVTVDPHFLDELVTAAEALPDAAALCPKVYFHDRPSVICSTGGRVNAWTGTSRQVGRGEEDRGQRDEAAVRDYADGACMLIRREALERVGLLDEEYFAYWEETDWCARAAEAGYRCYYAPAAKVWHKAARSQAPDSDFYFLFRRNAFLFLRKRKSPLHLLSALFLYLFAFGPFYLIRHPGAIRRVPGEARALLWHFGSLLRLPRAAAP
ncbi:MAG: glycosyltransferase family 2 protein [Chloroflexi bacterium]|nr:glycosyltransferase family 2 protein [Chloroflexota bacterium]